MTTADTKILTTIALIIVAVLMTSNFENNNNEKNDSELRLDHLAVIIGGSIIFIGILYVWLKETMLICLGVIMLSICFKKLKDRQMQTAEA